MAQQDSAAATFGDFGFPCTGLFRLSALRYEENLENLRDGTRNLMGVNVQDKIIYVLELGRYPATCGHCIPDSSISITTSTAMSASASRHNMTRRALLRLRVAVAAASLGC